MRLELAAQIVHHALDLAQHDGDRSPIRRLRDARGLIRLGRARREANELPRRRQPAHDQHEAVEEHVGLATLARSCDFCAIAASSSSFT